MAHIAQREVGCIEASREIPRRGTRRARSRIAGRAEVTRTAGYRAPIRSPDQEGVARRRQAPDQDENRAQDETRIATIPTNTQRMGGENLFIELTHK